MSFSVKSTVLAVAAAAASAALVPQAASAVEIQVYGRADAGILYTHVKGGEDSVQMKNGRSAPRFGFNAREDLGNGWTVKTYLENGYKLDSGEFGTSGTLFDRRAILAVASPYGEFGAGRAGTVQSSMAPYSMGLLRWDPFGTSYGNASIGSTFANTGRVNNGLHYISPVMAGFKFGASYSFGDASDDAVEWNDKNHTLALAANYQTQNFMAGLTFANIDAQHNGDATAPDARMYQAGGWWAVTPAVKLFGAVGYQTNCSTGGKLSATKLGASSDVANGGFDGESFLLGGTYTVGKNKFIADAQYFTGKLARESDMKFKRAVFAAAWEYYFAKNVIGYTALTHSITSGSAEKAARNKGAYDLEATQVFAGLNYLF